MVWTLIEPGIAIVAASMATIRPLLRRMRVRGFESTDDPSSYGHNSGWISSRRGKSRAGSVPLEELTLRDLEAKEPTTVTSSEGKLDPSVHSRTSTELNKSLPPIISKYNERSGTVRNPAFPAQSDTSSTSWRAQLRSPGSRSFEQIHELEAQNQDGGLRLSDARRR